MIIPPIVFLIPVLRRPDNVRPLLDSIAYATPPPYRVLFITDPDDYPEREAVAAQSLAADELVVCGGYSRKINAGVEATDEQLLFIGADDIRFLPGWLEIAVGAMTSPMIGVVGTNDLCNPVTATGHSTHSLVTRAYARRGTIDEPDKLLHEGYEHEWVDNELVETARYRDAYVHAPDCIVQHLHPICGGAPEDELYLRREERMRSGRIIYEQRRHLWTRQ